MFDLFAAVSRSLPPQVRFPEPNVTMSNSALRLKVPASAEILEQVRPGLACPPSPKAAGHSKNVGTMGQRVIDVDAILSAVGETAYTWDVASDRMNWAQNAMSVLSLSEGECPATLSEFALHIAAEHAASRSEAFAKASEHPGFRLHYRFFPESRRPTASIWIEEQGRITRGPDGQILKVEGVLRVLKSNHHDELLRIYRTDVDDLTGLLNRPRLIDALSTVLARTQTGEREGAFMMVAVNGLDVINDSFGYEAGDGVIAATGRLLSRHLRAGDSIGRYSANKFGIVLGDCTRSELHAFAERLISLVSSATVDAGPCRLAATISAGGLKLSREAASTSEVIANALQALDQARAQRRDPFVEFKPASETLTRRRHNLNLADEVMTALGERRMLLAIQPIVSTSTRKPAFYECLIRKRRPDGSVVAAAEFMEVAEQLGLSRLTDLRVLELTVDLLRRQHDISASLNVSSLAAFDRDWLGRLLSRTGGDRKITSRLTIEITETSEIRDIDRVASFVDVLKELGCKVAIDDFGAGYTSFKNLRHLNVDMVKIDGAFVRNMKDDATDRIFVETLVNLARRFKLKTVAEWVTDEETADLLAGYGVDYLQGNLFGAPVLVDEFEAKLAAKP